MWMQILAAAIPALGVGIPLTAYVAGKTRARFASALADVQQMGEEQPSTEDNPYADWPERFAAALRALEQRALENTEHNIYGAIVGLIQELQTLDAKLKASGVEQQLKLAYVKYIPLIRKILELTASDRYGDFIRNPNHWNDPKRMRIQVELAVLVVAKEVGKDIRRFHTNQELGLQINLESILGKAAASRGEQDQDAALAELLSVENDVLEEVSSDLDSLTAAVARESAEAESRREEERRKIQAELEEAKLQAASKAELEEKARLAEPREMLLRRELHQQTYTIYSKSGTDAHHLVSYSDEITGKKDWRRFKSAFEAAQWVDEAVRIERKKHDFNCSCVYCRDSSA